ncbi:MAG: 8-oxo-dGTP diphosphatase [Clostridiales bacterium]|nr:8-oxo-dGTP diphosphatase [Clostridiales bacterium]
MLETSLCYLSQGNQVLMLHRVSKKDDVNAGKWVGVGGKLEPGETPEACALREIREETGLTPTSLRYRGIVDFRSEGWEERMHLFTGETSSGSLSDCDEGKLAWVERETMLSLPIWEGDRIFLRLIAEDEPFFRLLLVYEGELLVSAVLNGKPLSR